MFEQSLFLKKQHIDFLTDMTLLLTEEVRWSFEKAVELVENEIIIKIPGEAWKGGS